MRLLPAVLLSLLAACASEPKSTARLRPVGELPPVYKDTWVAWVEQAADWSERREAVLADPKLASFLVDNLARTMLKSYRAGAIAGAHDLRVGPFERSRAELVRMGAHAVPTLAELMAIGDATTALLCGEQLVEIGRPSIDYVLGLLERKEPHARARAAEVLGQLPHAGAKEPAVVAALVAATGDAEWFVRESATEALGHRGTRATEIGPTRQALSRALMDDDPEVGRAAAFGLARLADPEAIPALLNFLERAEREADLVSYEAGQRALRALSRTQKSRSPREWRDWWRANRPSRTSGGNQ
ncbi:MAG: HEAT repeat domain-containing protein [Planctomycetota bacterium]|nr:HEAT repeat domain-containing protein [Planctomycetota bacterium]